MSTMIQPTKNRYGVYILRMAVPAELKSTLGKGEIKRSLKTKDLAEAKLRAPAVTALMQAEIEYARKILNAELSVTDDDIERIASVWLTFILSKPELVKERYLSDYPYGLDLTLESRTIVEYLRQENNVSASYDAPDISVMLGYSDPYPSITPEQRDIEILQLVKNELAEALELFPAQLTPRWIIKLAWRLADYRNQAAGMLAEGIVLEYKATEIHEETKASISFSELFEEYKEYIHRAEPKRAESRIRDYSVAINRFIEFIGGKPINTINKIDLAEFRILLEKLPFRANKETKRLPLQKQTELQGKKISPATVKNQLMAISAVFSLAEQNGVIDVNPISQLPKRKTTTTEQKNPTFTEAEITQIFQLPVFRGEKTPHGAIAYWLPIIQYYTGARVEEIAQLYVKNIRHDKGITCIDIENTDDQSTKTGLSRTVPLNEHIIELGFLDYVNSRRGQTLLFDVKKNPAGKYSYNVGRWWGKYIRSNGISRKDIKPNHSFRHTFITLCRSTNARKDVQNDIVGHAQEDVSGGYGSYPIEAKKDLVEKIPRLNLQRLSIWERS
ncbi:integrase [Providencia alcalifaciens]|nr:integrase [Providencia alcalifaciens]